MSSFSEHGDHRDLHSFPTRRSSDLSTLFSAPSFSWPSRNRGRMPRMNRMITTPMIGTVSSEISARGTLVRRRSEEHTSELQSLAYLVCRLLLEKKKNRRSH